MTTDQLRELLATVGLSQRGAARELGIDERTMRRYCAGKLPIPIPIQLALRWMTRSKNDDLS